MTAVDDLRDAASLMRKHAEAATAGSWWVYDGQPWYGNEARIRQFDADAADDTADEVAWDEELKHAGTLFHGDVVSAADSDHIASWHPVVALAVADLLDFFADAAESGNDIPALRGRGLEQALVVARTYLGRES